MISFHFNRSSSTTALTHFKYLFPLEDMLYGRQEYVCVARSLRNMKTPYRYPVPMAPTKYLTGKSCISPADEETIGRRNHTKRQSDQFHSFSWARTEDRRDIASDDFVHLDSFPSPSAFIASSDQPSKSIFIHSIHQHEAVFPRISPAFSGC